MQFQKRKEVDQKFDDRISNKLEKRKNSYLIYQSKIFRKKDGKKIKRYQM